MAISIDPKSGVLSVTAGEQGTYVITATDTVSGISTTKTITIDTRVIAESLNINGSDAINAEGTYNYGVVTDPENADTDINWGVEQGSSESIDIVLKYNVATAGEYVLYYTGVQPKAAAGPYSTFTEGTTAKIYNEAGDLVETIDLYQPKDAEATVNYTFAEAGLYTIKICNVANNANGRPQTGSEYDDSGMSVYPNLFRGASWGVIDGTKIALSGIEELNLPAETTNIGQMFNSCKARGKCPSINLPNVQRATGLFNASAFDEIGDVILPNANTTLTDQGEWSDGHQMFANMGNLTKAGDIILGNVIYANQMFYNDSKLAEIGVLDVLKNVVKAENIFAGCTSLANVKIKSLPIAATTIDLSACPLNATSLDYMAENVNDGAATVKFSSSSKELENYTSVKSALEAKGYTIS